MQPSYEQLLIENGLLKGIIAGMEEHIKNLEGRIANLEALRNLVIARKLCFGSRSIYEKKWRATLHSCLETLGRHKKSMLDFLAGVIQEARTGQPIPSVL